MNIQEIYTHYLHGAKIRRDSWPNKTYFIQRAYGFTCDDCGRNDQESIDILDAIASDWIVYEPEKSA